MTGAADGAARAEEIIEGGTTLRLADAVAFRLARWPAMLAMLVLWIVIAVVVMAAVSMLTKRPVAWTDPTILLGRATLDILFIGLLAGSAALLTSLLFEVAFLRRLPAAQRRLHYHADGKAIELRDEAGFVLNTPWSAVTKVRVGYGLLLLKFGTFWRFVPLRAFSPEDGRRLVALAEAGKLPRT